MVEELREGKGGEKGTWERNNKSKIVEECWKKLRGKRERVRVILAKNKKIWRKIVSRIGYYGS